MKAGNYGDADPGDSAGLSLGEHLLVSSLRRMAAGDGACPLIARAFADACGARAQLTMAAFALFFAILARSGRRRLRVAPPGAVGMTVDERLLLAVFAAAQADATTRLRAHLDWLARRPDSARLEIAASVVAAGLALNGHRLPLPPARKYRPPAPGA